MGVKQIVTDDLTGKTLTDDTKPTDVTVNGKDYSVYLSPESLETFIALVSGEAPLLQDRKPAAPGKSKANGAKVSTETYGFDYAEVKTWAIANGIKAANGNPVTEKTPRIGQSVYDAYKDAQA